MGSWNFGSADCDAVLDWYPSEFDEEMDEFIPPTAKALNAALKSWIAADPRRQEDRSVFLGIVVKGLSENVVPSAAHLKKALAIAQSLIADNGHLDDYGPNQAKRKAALTKELGQLQRVLGGEPVAPQAKLTTGLFESIAMAATARRKGLINVKRSSGRKSTVNAKRSVDRPSPSASATAFKPGTRKKGNDGKFWKVSLTKSNVHRWIPA